MYNINMIAGERRRVTVSVTADGGTDFAIRNPVWVLTRNGQRVDGGTPVVSGTEMVCLIAPDEAGDYLLQYTFEVAGEVIIKRVAVYAAP